MKINESNFVEELSHRNEKALEYVMVHYGGLVKSVTHRYLNVLSQYEEECINDVFFAVWEHIDSYDSARNPFRLQKKICTLSFRDKLGKFTAYKGY